MPAKRVANHIQRSLRVPVLVNSGGQIQVSPVQVVHLETTQGVRFGLADASVIQRQGAEAALCGVFGKAAVKALWYAGRAGNYQLRAWLGGVIQRGG
jgi:hypothetical protein